MKFATSVFKAYDIRGLAGTELTVELVEAIGRALADWLPEAGPVAVGRDLRPESGELAGALVVGLRRQGRKVLDIGTVPSDMLTFAVGHLGAAGGAMVTASHEPGQFDGIKLCRDGANPIGADTGLADIKALVASDGFKPAQALGELEGVDLLEDWLQHALSFVDVSKWPPYKVAIDTGNGMAGLVVPHLRERTPLQIVPMYFELDGTFPNHPPNPLEPANLQDLILGVQADKLDFGIAFDGDGDRAVLVDELGRPVSGNVLLALLAEHFLQLNPGATILCDVRCSRRIDEVVAGHGGTLRRTRVGHSFIKEAMRQYGAVLAGELSGHYYFKDNYYADSGLIAALIAVQILAESGKKLSQLVDTHSKYVQSGEINFEVSDAAAKIEALAAKFGDGQSDRLDGLTVNYPNWWFNVRPSNTEPLLRLNVEAEDEQLLKEKLAELKPIISG